MNFLSLATHMTTSIDTSDRIVTKFLFDYFIILCPLASWMLCCLVFDRTMTSAHIHSHTSRRNHTASACSANDDDFNESISRMDRMNQQTVKNKYWLIILRPFLWSKSKCWNPLPGWCALKTKNRPECHWHRLSATILNYYVLRLLVLSA